MAVSAGETIFKKSNYSENESDIWDDTALIEAYDNAVSDMQKQLSGHGVEIKKNSSPVKDSKEKGKNNQKRKRKKKQAKNKSDRRAEPTSSIQWKVGGHCRAVYTEDGEIYEAIIKSVDLSNNTTVVRFLGYGNEEEYELDDLLPSEAVMSRQQRRMSQTSEVYSESDVSLEGHTWQQQQHRRGSVGSSRGRGMRGPSPMQGTGHPHPAPPPPQMVGWGGPPPFHPTPPPPMHPWVGPPGVSPLQSMVGGQPPLIPPMFASPDCLSSSFPNPMTMPSVPPPPPPILDIDDVDKDKEALHNMLISWYMSGYSTGYYQGLKDGKQRMNTTQAGASSESKEQEASARKT